jgi:tetratricopeptide (TPR) repeat protein/GTPase SAR1 family protein
MPTLRIEHVPESDPSAFTITDCSATITGADGRPLPEVTVPAPDTLPITEESERTLSGEVQWYLEKYLTRPFSPNAERAERAIKALQEWGREAFTRLFDRDVTGGPLNDLVAGRKVPAIQVESNDPRVLAWPWEGLCHSTLGFLAHHARITRSLAEAPDPHDVPTDLPRDRINVLLVTARPKEEDIDYRSVSRPLVELIDEKELPAAVHVLRPPTLDQLRSHLRENPHTYHILHFDGHGGFGSLPAADRDDVFRSPTGKLLFEEEDGSRHEVSARSLNRVLREHEIPAVVLNACQSATIDARAEDAFSSVAAALLQAGTRSVVAMGYSLYVSSARRFLPDFYERLFDEGDLAEAVRAGRQGMETDKKRLSAAGPIRFEDWLMPVHYHQAALRLSFGDDGDSGHLVEEDETPDVTLPEEGQERGQTLYDFFGRDATILEIERAMRRDPASILVHGLGGVGKTSLAWELLRWLKRTGGLTNDPIWINFDEVRSAEYVLDRIGEQVYDEQFRSVTAGIDPEDADERRRARLETKVDLIADRLTDEPYVIVWDNFESAAGIEEASVEPLLDADDRQVLRGLLTTLREGETTVLITSRGVEDWLPERVCYKERLTGLQGEDRWRLTRAILRDLGKTNLQEDETVSELVNELRGHPLALQALLPQLSSHSSSTLLARLQGEIDTLDREGDEMTERLFATLRFVEDTIPEDLRELLVPLSLHERFVDDRLLAGMCDAQGSSFDRDDVDRLLSTLTTAGLVQPLGANVYSVHPMLTSYLRSSHENGVAEQGEWSNAFVEIMAQVAGEYDPTALRDQHPMFAINESNFEQALEIAKVRVEDLDDPDEILKSSAVLGRSLGEFARNKRQFDRAESLYRIVKSVRQQLGDKIGIAISYHQLGIIAQNQHEYGEARKLYKKSLNISQEQGHEYGLGMTLHQTGRVEEKMNNFDEARKRFEKALKIRKRQGNNHDLAETYHELGIVAQEQGEFNEAQTWIEKALKIFENQDNQHGASLSYHQLGVIMQRQREFAEAETWLEKSVELKKRLNNELGVASSYSQMGTVAREQRKLGKAETFFEEALEIRERLNDEHGAASTYHLLGSIAEEQREFDEAERWYKKSLKIKERLDDDLGAARSYHALGRSAQKSGRLDKAETFLQKALRNYESRNDDQYAATHHQLGVLAQKRGNYKEAQNRYEKALEIHQKRKDPYRAAETHHQLGTLAQVQGNYREAKNWYKKVLEYCDKQDDKHLAAGTYNNLGGIEALQGEFVEAGRLFLKSATTYTKLQDRHRFQTQAQNFLKAFVQASGDRRAKLREMWIDAGLPEEPLREALEAEDESGSLPAE